MFVWLFFLSFSFCLSCYLSYFLVAVIKCLGISNVRKAGLFCFGVRGYSLPWPGRQGGSSRRQQLAASEAGKQRGRCTLCSPGFLLFGLGSQLPDGDIPQDRLPHFSYLNLESPSQTCPVSVKRPGCLSTLGPWDAWFGAAAGGGGNCSAF